MIKKYHGLDITDKKTELTMLKHLNAYACSTSVRGNKIATGQILNIKKKEDIVISKKMIERESIEEEIVKREVIEGKVIKREVINGKVIEKEVEEDQIIEEFYICLTPACDLEPNQSNDWKESLGSLMPIKLIRLHESEKRFVGSKKQCTDEKILSDLNSNDHLLLDIQGEIKGFTIIKAPGANPQWEQAFAFDRGYVSWATDIETKTEYACATVHRIYFDDKERKLNENITKCQVVAQLRYEYAINLLQKFGASQSRVGLDFIQYKEKK